MKFPFTKVKKANPLTVKELPIHYDIMRDSRGFIFAFEKINTRDLIEFYESVAPVNTAINKIANVIGGLTPILLNTVTKEKILEHPVLTLLNHPNEENQKTKRDFLRDMTIWRILEGDTYVDATGDVTRPPIELFVINPRDITIEQDTNGFIKLFRRTIGTHTQQTEVFTRTNPSDVNSRSPNDRFINAANNGDLLHLTNFNPRFASGNLDGMSEVQPLQLEISQYIQAGQHNLALLTNGGRPSGAFVLKNEAGVNTVMSEANFERLKKDIADTTSGATNAGKILLLEGGLEWQEMSISPKDMDFKALKDAAEKQIFKTLGVPIELIMAEGTTFGNLANVRLEFYENRILPLAKDIMMALSRFLLPRYSDTDNLELVIDEDIIDVLLPKKIIQRDSVEKSTTMTLNEKRKLLNLPPVLLGDNVFDPNGRAIAGEDVSAVGFVSDQSGSDNT